LSDDQELQSALGEEEEASRSAEPTRPRQRRERSRRLVRRHPDIEVARLLVRRGLLLKRDAVDALRTQKKRAKANKPRIPFLRLLVERDALDEEDLHEAQEEIRRNTYICDHCDARAVILAGSQTRAGACPRCGHEISVEPPSDPDAAPAPADLTGSATDPWRPMRAGPGLDKLAPGEVVFERYELRREIGRGAMGVVWLARHRDLDKDVALKVLVPGSEEAREHQVARFRREAAAVQKLRHEGIIAVHDFGTDGDLHYLTMDVVEGGNSLHRVLKRRERPLPLRDRLDALIQVAHAVHHAHERGVVHRDLKPANVLIAPSGRPLVVDFGLAKDEEAEAAELTRTHDRLGTPLFMAPEQIRRGASTVDARADVWALGVMLFVALTGRYPFRSRTVMDLYLRIMREPPDWTGTRYSAPDHGSFRLTESSTESAASGADSVDATRPADSQEQTEISSRAGPDGALPRTLTPERPKLGATPPPFAPPPDLPEGGVPKDLKAIVECALAKDQEDRYASAEELAKDLERYLGGRPIQARRPSLVKRVRGQLYRRRVLIPLAITLAALTLVLGGGIALAIASLSQQAAEEETRAEIALAWEQTGGKGSLEGYADAVAAMGRQLDAHPEHPLALYRRGAARLRLLEVEAAAADLAAAEEGADEALAERVAAERALLHLLEGRPDEAVAAARRAIAAAEPPTAETALRLAHAALIAGDPDALAFADAQCGRRCADGAAPERLVAAWARLAVARGASDEARARLPAPGADEHFELSLVRGALALEAGDLEAAREHLGRGRAAWFYSNYRLEGDVKYFNDLGYRLKKEGDVRRGLLANFAASRLAPFHPSPRYYEGRLWLTGALALDAARSAFEDAYALDPYGAVARDLLLAIHLADPDATGAALAVLERDATLRPDAAEPRLLAAAVHLRTGDLERAEALLGEVDDARAGLARAALVRLRGGAEQYAAELAEGYAPGGPSAELQDAVEVARAYLEAEPARPRQALRLLGDLPADLADVRDTVDRRRAASGWVLAARARAAVAREDEAVAALARAITADPFPPEAVPGALRAAPELAPLGERDDFRALLAELDARAAAAEAP